mmetsp:Transcript_32633/g.90004  ORF Transcript_32633/g.90004 Transcript_32633/m.90004 type:complete len:86 (-) Transcript_32633:144-401(-)
MFGELKLCWIVNQLLSTLCLVLAGQEWDLCALWAWAAVTCKSCSRAADAMPLMQRKCCAYGCRGPVLLHDAHTGADLLQEQGIKA